jgi:hypothetical protein
MRKNHSILAAMLFSFVMVQCATPPTFQDLNSRGSELVEQAKSMREQGKV